jgi:hypothetical protein
VNRPGAFAEYIVLPMTNIWRHHHDIDLDIAAIFDPFGNAVHTGALVSGAGRGRADHGRGSHRVDGDCGRASRWRALRGRRRI